ncbi:putative transposase, mutator type, MULE transposase domain protein [Tanacetum coccineum]|uniref:Transposase, mutator type, MULE transposase domain protein n=1 Tax=Tanacetum coccineum TaxID=301880 RepID=A0ABQ5GF77_9ASTR
MHTTLVPEQVKTLKIQAGIQVSRPEEHRRHLQHWKSNTALTNSYLRRYFIKSGLIWISQLRLFKINSNVTWRRDLLGLDGAFIKGTLPGQVLAAVGLDLNNQIYPLSYALVEAKSKSSWCWFLQCLGDDIDLHPNSNFTFSSDIQKVEANLIYSSTTSVSVIDKFTGPLTPTATRIMKSIKKEAHLMKVQQNGANKYQVSCLFGDQCVVDVVTMTCSCRK